MPQQLNRLAIVFVVLIGGLIGARHYLVPKTFGALGHYRAAAIDAKDPYTKNHSAITAPPRSTRLPPSRSRMRDTKSAPPAIPISPKCTTRPAIGRWHARFATAPKRLTWNHPRITCRLLLASGPSVPCATHTTRQGRQVSRKSIPSATTQGGPVSRATILMRQCLRTRRRNAAPATARSRERRHSPNTLLFPVRPAIPCRKSTRLSRYRVRPRSRKRAISAESAIARRRKRDPISHALT